MTSKRSKNDKNVENLEKGLSSEIIPYYLIPIFTQLRLIFSEIGFRAKRAKKDKTKIARFCEHSWTFFFKGAKMAKNDKNDIFDKKW